MDDTQSSRGSTAAFKPDLMNHQSHAGDKSSTSVVGVYERRPPARVRPMLLLLGLLAVGVILAFLIVGRVLF